MGLGMFGADAVLVLIEAEGDQIVLERGNTVEPPRGVGEGLDELIFEGADGFVVVEESASEGLVGRFGRSGRDGRRSGMSAFCRLRFWGRWNGPHWRNCARCGRG